ncbi:fibrinogen alpha chain-like [Coregonus clupeaformis]|uniref:fibrinogen alpha chain-like n=1 Tax=Coregonus clupeaformis TaxID=59861 RepID=UPI001BDFEA16|nr:fibrinogen alpha chain-like [Coregonus clupeaformis]
MPIPGPRPKPGPKPKPVLKLRPSRPTGSSSSIPETNPRTGSTPATTSNLSPKTTSPSSRTTSSSPGISFTPSPGSLSRTTPSQSPAITTTTSSSSKITSSRIRSGSFSSSIITLSHTPATKTTTSPSSMTSFTSLSSRTTSTSISPETKSAQHPEPSSTIPRLSIKPKPRLKPKPDQKPKPGPRPIPGPRPGPKLKPVLKPRTAPKLWPKTTTQGRRTTSPTPSTKTSTSSSQRTMTDPSPQMTTSPGSRTTRPNQQTTLSSSSKNIFNTSWKTTISPGTMTTTFASLKCKTSSSQQTSISRSPKTTTTKPIPLANSTHSPTTTNPESTTPSPIPGSSTPSVRELRVKTSRVSASLNDTKDTSGGPKVLQRGHPKVRPGLNLLMEKDQVGSKTDRTGNQPQSLAQISSGVTMAPRDCSDHMAKGERNSGVYQVTPDPKNGTIAVFCDMESHGGGWTVIQLRQDGSVNFNRTWAEYRTGFGNLRAGEFWLGNDHIHLLTRHREMVLRVELEDFNRAREYAEYRLFRVAGERLRYRLSVGGYSGTAGDALQFSKSYDHNNRFFTTPDRDYDRYPSGNCGAYYGSGWWFDACMAANLNGRYYVGKYKGVRNGIYWGTWHNISTEYYPTNDRQSFMTVRMMIRPRGYAK